MTVSAYQVDSVIKAYSKQNRMKVRPLTSQDIRPEESRSGDVVTLSMGMNNPDAYKAISYNLLDVILKTKEH
jgi:hypothetical protein